MKDKRPILLILLIVAITIVIVALLSFEKKPQIYTDISELYSHFTDYMKMHVDSSLQLLRCEPQQYSDNGSTICFMCDGAGACFGYSWVNRGSVGMKINPKGLPYLNNIGDAKGLKIKFVDFCYEGLASQFDCQEREGYNYLECNKIKFLARFDNIFKCESINIELMEGVDFQDFAEYFCELEGEELESFEFHLEDSSYEAFCQNYMLFYKANKIDILKGNLNEG